MTNTQIGLLIIQGLLSVGVSLYVAYEWFKGKREQQKYKLYAMRDALLELLATGKLSEDDPLFTLFYNVINKSTAELIDLTFVSFVKASMRAKLVLERQEKAEQLRVQIEHANPAVRRFVSTFASTMMQIMTANSLMLMFVLRVGVTGHAAMRKLIQPHRFA